ncbi:unnamed protein product, partial [Brenthis ino]
MLVSVNSGRLVCQGSVITQKNHLVKILGATENHVTERHLKRCCPYNFDSKFCRAVGDRILCGYNRNVGTDGNDDGVDLHNGCRLKHGRLECGYHQPPYTNSRRPLVSDDVDSDQEYTNIDTTSSSYKKLYAPETTKSPQLTSQYTDVPCVVYNICR